MKTFNMWKKIETLQCAAVDTAWRGVAWRGISWYCVLAVGLRAEMMRLLKLSAETCVEGFCLTRVCVYTWVWH
jgi:hypothetical protein